MQQLLTVELHLTIRDLCVGDNSVLVFKKYNAYCLGLLPQHTTFPDHVPRKPAAAVHAISPNQKGEKMLNHRSHAVRQEDHLDPRYQPVQAMFLCTPHEVVLVVVHGQQRAQHDWGCQGLSEAVSRAQEEGPAL